MSQRYLGLDYLRALLIVRVVSMHSVSAYTNFGGAAPPGVLRFFDPHKWEGFLYYGIVNDVYGMPLLFCVSGLFVWSGLTRRGALGYGIARARRLGIPFLLVALVLLPAAVYPAERIDGAYADLIGYVKGLLAGQAWAPSPVWFIWLLLAFDLCAAAIFRLAPGAFKALGQVAAGAAQRPARVYLRLIVCGFLFYVPMMMAFGPFSWSWIGPFAVQMSRILLYALYFAAGVGVGAYGLSRGPLASTSVLVRHWGRWVALAAVLELCYATVVLALGAELMQVSVLLAVVVFGLAFVATGAATAFALLAVFQRFVTRRIAIGDSLAANSYGIYLVHVIVVLWAQYFLLSAPLPALIKAAIVFCTALGLSWAGTALWRRLARGLRRTPPALRPLAPEPIPASGGTSERAHG